MRIENAPLVASKSVLLLDDIARSGASLTTWREMLYEARASLV
jgi:adenine/guanine phosphoribosyltransferase-like PRPP-binding protein